MKKLILLLTFINCSLLAIAQNDSDTRNIGSATTLTGKTYILSVFVSTSNAPWSKNEKRQCLQRQADAQRWLSNEARKYDSEATFETGNFGLDQDIVLNQIPDGDGSGDENVDWVTTVLKTIGYTSPKEFNDWVHSKTQCQHAVVLIYANGIGTSYAMAYGKGMSERKYFVEGCVLFKQYTNKKDLYAATIAHEILHLYGAWDLYATFSQGGDREAEAKKRYPNDIMLRVTPNVGNLNIGPLTAWLVGLNKKKGDDVDWFRPAGRGY